MKHGGSRGSLSAAATAVAEVLRCQFGVVMAAAAAAWLQRQHGGSGGNMVAVAVACLQWQRQWRKRCGASLARLWRWQQQLGCSVSAMTAARPVF